MSDHYLTQSFDLHGGGMDLTFPHHENEIAQSCAASSCSESKVSYWLHIGFVKVNEEKISKSLKNFFTIREVTKLYHPLALRHFLLSTHYQSEVDYSISQIEESSETTWQDCEDAVHQEGSQKEVSLPNGKTVPITPPAEKYLKKLIKEFESKIAHDLHTPTLLKDTLVEGFKLINSSLNLLKKQQKQQFLSSIQSLVELAQGIKAVLDVLGLLSSLTYSQVLEQLKEKALKRANMKNEDIKIRIAERAVARKNKQFSRGDEIRKDCLIRALLSRMILSN